MDPRTERTRDRLDAAFVELLHHRPYDTIRVSDIIRGAKVGRATFYAHYEDKNALLRSQVDRIVAPLLRPHPAKPWLVDCTAFFEHVATSRRLYRSLTFGAAGAAASRVIQEGIEAHIRAVLRERAQTNDLTVEPAIAARFVASTIGSLIGWSTEGGAGRSPSELQSVYERLVGKALQ